MPLMQVAGIEVEFPYQPYGPQVRYMTRVIEALRAGDNALLESPTGTGKTLCLLCAALAWRSVYVAALQARAANALTAELAAKSGVPEYDGDGGTFAALAALVRPGAEGKASAALRAPRIVYASRTHTQLAQAVRELQATAYQPGVVQLASRDQLCIHAISKKLSGARLNSACRTMTAPSKRGCRFHLPIASPRPEENKSKELVQALHASPPMDIEELRLHGERAGACPWFLARTAAHAESCDVLFVPYAYLMDRAIRATLDLDWANDILIVDEAHNLPDVCAAAMSFDLTAAQRAGCIRELDACITRGLKPLGINIPALENLAQTEQGLDAVLGTENKDMLEFRILRSVLRRLEEFVDEVKFPERDSGDVEYAVFEPAVLRDLLASADGPTADTYELFLELLDRAMDNGAKNDEVDADEDGEGETATASSGPSRANNPLQLLQTAVRVLFETRGLGHEESFRLVVHAPVDANAGSRRTLSYWCFDPSIAMHDLKKLGLRCMLLTSGTLSPMDSFSRELGGGFTVKLENPHVITSRQVLAGVVPEAPGGGARLSSAYRKRSEATEKALGRALLHVVGSVPDGVLVFFPSFGSLAACVKTWKRVGPGADGARPSVWEHLSRRKAIVLEERGAGLGKALEAHRIQVDARNGSVLLAVCRGRVSEGIDFSDAYARAVVITGLPYPSAFDPRVRLMRELCDTRCAKEKANGVQQSMPGAEWYAVQALRAVNQAVGRAIRHRNDYGVVLLCDERFSAPNVIKKVSGWLRQGLRVYDKFDNVARDVDAFFEYAESAPFARPENTKKALAGKAAAEQAKKKVGPLVVSASAASGAIVAQPRAAPVLDDTVMQGVEDFSQVAPEEVKARPLELRARALAAPPQAQSSITARFLARRAAAADEMTQARKAALTRPPTSAGGIAKRPRPKSTVAAQAPLAKRARSLLTGKAECREFAALFRGVLTAGKRLSEAGTDLAARRSAEQSGVTSARATVRYARANTTNSAECGAWLGALRARIPERFRGAWDDALRE